MGFPTFFIFVSIFCCAFQFISAQTEYQRIALDLHNQYRQKHRVGPLTLSDDLNSRAIRCAQYYADKGQIDHQCPYKNGAGENLYWGSGSPSDVNAARSATNSWYSEEPQYDYNGDWQPAAGHFTQMVWKNSRELGVGTGRSGNRVYVCALYNPRGNMQGSFKNNVFRP